MVEQKSLILVTGATGYVGGRLVPRLLQAGYRVRVLVRDKNRLQGRSWLPMVEVVEGDVATSPRLQDALLGCTAAYYLIHSMTSTEDFHRRDLVAARRFGCAARQAGVQRIIYLGGLGNPASDLSRHLRSRQETGDALRESGVSVTEFQAAIIVGSGSVSFEIIRYLTERLPVIICPRWVFTRVQPIAIRDVLAYLIAALNREESHGQVIEIGGADVLTYHAMILRYARFRRLRRLLIPLPVFSPRLSSFAMFLITPVSAGIIRPLIEGLRNEVIVHTDLATRLFPEIKPLNYDTALLLALERIEHGMVETSWSDALVTSQGHVPPVTLTVHEGLHIERRRLLTAAPADQVFRIYTSLGGEHGWLHANWTWRLRGFVDRLVGGVGLRRGRRHPTELHIGDAVDFWRVENIIPGRLLRLRAEMKLPGRAWLEFESIPQPDGCTLLTQTAYFASHGVLGILYWYGLYPLHHYVFSGLIREIMRRATSP